MNKREYPVGGIGAHMVLAVMSLLYLINFMDRQVLSAVLEPMRIDLGLNDFQAGAVQTIFLLGIALFSFPVAYLADRWSRRKAVALMAVIWSVFTFLTGLGRSFLGVVIPRAIVGVGEAGFTAGGTAMVSASYPSRSRAAVLGVFSLFSGLGAVMGVVLGGVISKKFGGWQTPFFVFAVPGLILGVAAFFLRDYKTADEVDAAGKRLGFFSSAAALFRIPTLRWLYLGHVMHNVMAFSMLTWLSAYFMRSRGVAEDKAGMLLGIISLMAVVGAPLGGVLADLWQKKNPRGRMLWAAVADIAAALFIVVALFLNVAGVGFGLALIWCFFTMSALPALASITQDVVKPGLKSMAWGMAVFVMYILGGGWAPMLVGMISDSLGGGAEGLRIALMIMSGGGLVGGTLFFFGSRHYPADQEKVGDHTLEKE
jgi:MFS family permease